QIFLLRGSRAGRARACARTFQCEKTRLGATVGQTGCPVQQDIVLDHIPSANSSRTEPEEALLPGVRNRHHHIRDDRLRPVDAREREIGLRPQYDVSELPVAAVLYATFPTLRVGRDDGRKGGPSKGAGVVQIRGEFDAATAPAVAQMAANEETVPIVS